MFVDSGYATGGRENGSGAVDLGWGVANVPRLVLRPSRSSWTSRHQRSRRPRPVLGISTLSAARTPRSRGTASAEGGAARGRGLPAEAGPRLRGLPRPVGYSGHRAAMHLAVSWHARAKQPRGPGCIAWARLVPPWHICLGRPGGHNPETAARPIPGCRRHFPAWFSRPTPAINKTSIEPRSSTRPRLLHPPRCGAEGRYYKLHQALG